MSQYPMPYPPPGGPGYPAYPPIRDPRSAGRWASVLMYVLGALLLLCGGGIVAGSAIANWDEMMQKVEQVNGPEFTAQMRSQGTTPAQVKAIMIFCGVMGLIVAVGYLVLAFFVGRVNMGAIITSIVVTGLVALSSLCPGISALVMSTRTGPQGLLGGCMMLIPLLLSIVLMVLLINAARVASRWKQYQQMYAAQYWHHQQQQAAYQQAAPPPLGQGYAYGYGVPPAAPPQAPPAAIEPPAAPPQPPPNETGGTHGDQQG